MGKSGERWNNSPTKHKSLALRRFAKVGKSIFFVIVPVIQIRMTIKVKHINKKKVGFSVRKPSHLMPLAMCYVHKSHLCVACYPTRRQKYTIIVKSPNVFAKKLQSVPRNGTGKGGNLSISPFENEIILGTKTYLTFTDVTSFRCHLWTQTQRPGRSAD